MRAWRRRPSRPAASSRPPSTTRSGFAVERGAPPRSAVGRGRLAVAVGARRRDRPDALGDGAHQRRGRAPAGRSCASGSPRCRSTPGAPRQHQGERPRPEALRHRVDARHRARPAPSACAADAHSTAIGTSAAPPLQREHALDRAARRRQRGQPVHGVGRQHHHPAALEHRHDLVDAPVRHVDATDPDRPATASDALDSTAPIGPSG